MTSASPLSPRSAVVRYNVAGVGSVAGDGTTVRESAVPELTRPVIASLEEYGRIFRDLAFWRPYVIEICRRHGRGDAPDVRETHPGTYPVFIVNESYVVKIFGEWVHGAWCHRFERAMYDLLPGDPAIPAPALVAGGELFSGDDDWPWPYLVSTVLPGRPLHEDAALLGDDGRRDVAMFLGDVLRRVHALRPATDSPLALTWTAFDDLMRQQRDGLTARHRGWSTLPARLIAQIDGWLPPLDELIDHGAPPHALHGDLNADHVFGLREGDRWRPTEIIDFGDAVTGDRAYDLVALHLGTFAGDRRWLRTFLDAYGFDAGLRRDFARRQLAMTLLHEFNVLGGIVPRHLELAAMESLDELAERLWGVDLVEDT